MREVSHGKTVTRMGAGSMSDSLNRAEFSASIPNIMSGLKMGGDGCRLQLDIPETDMGEAVKLVAMRGKRLRVTVEVQNGDKGDLDPRFG